MPVPLSGLQRVVLSGANYMYQGHDRAETADYLRKTFDYLTAEQVNDVVGHAELVRRDADVFRIGGEGETIGERMMAAQQAGVNRVADVRFRFTDATGVDQWRTVRIRYANDMTPQEFMEAVESAAKQILGGDSLTGNDTVTIVPPDASVNKIEVVAFL